MIPTEKMIEEIPPKDGWKSIYTDLSKEAYFTLPNLKDILWEFVPSALPEEYLAEFRRRYPYKHDDYYEQHKQDIYPGYSLAQFRCIDEGVRAYKKRNELEKWYYKLVIAGDDFRAGLITEEELSQIYDKARKKLIEAIGVTASAYIAFYECWGNNSQHND